MRYLIWDFDGTLGQREGGWSGAMLDVLRANGLADGIARDDIRPHILTGFRWHDPSRHYPPALPANAWWEELHPLFAAVFASVCPVSPSRALELASQVRGEYLRADAWRLFEDSRPALRALSAAGHRHMILSNHVPELSQILEGLCIADDFQCVLNSAATGYEKPHPQSYALARALLPPDARAIMIGDNPKADYAGGRAAGLDAILVRRFTPGLTPYYATLTELAKALMRDPH